MPMRFKHIVTSLLVLLSACCLFAAEQKITFSADCSWLHNIGMGLQTTIKGKVSNPLSKPETIKFSLIITDIQGRQYRSNCGSIYVGGGSQKDFSFPVSLPHRGYFDVELAGTIDNGVSFVDKQKFSIGSTPDFKSMTVSDSPFGVNGHAANGYYGTFKTLGVGFSRSDLDWRSLEKAPGKWDFPRWDNILPQAEKEQIKIYGILGYNPDWLVIPKGKGTDSEKFLKSVRRTVERYKGRIAYWDIWNEPDLTWKGKKSDFGVLAAKAYRIIKQIDPNTLVCYPGASGGDFHSGLKGFTIPSLAKLNGRFPFDVLAIHPYSRPASPESQNLRKKLLFIKNWMSTHAPGKPLWISECGWPTSTDTFGVSEHLQAAYLTRLFVLGLSAGVEKFVWYQPFSAPNVAYHENQYGFLRAGGSPKPAALAFAQVVYRLSKTTYDREIPLGADLRCFVFRTKNYTLAVLWSLQDLTKLAMSLPKSATIELVDGTPAENTGHISLGPMPIYVMIPPLQSDELIDSIAGASISGVKPFNVQVGTSSEGVVVQLENKSNNDLLLELQLYLPPDWPGRRDVHKKQVALSVGSRKEVLLPLRYPRSSIREKIYVKLSDGKRKYSVPLTLDIEPVYYSENVVIDGNLGEWMTEKPIELNSIKNVAPADMQKEWKGIKDKSARVWFRWNRQGLYMAAKVRDDIHRNEASGSDIWGGDSLQIAIDHSKGPVPHNYGENTAEFTLALTTGGIEALRTFGAEALPGESFKAVVKRDERNQQTNYEFFVPWKSLMCPDIHAGTSLSINVIINENDGSGRHSWLQITPGIGAEKNPSRYMRFILVKDPGIS